MKLLALWEKHSRRPVGTNQHAVGVDNVHAPAEAPPTRRTGNTASAGMRRLQTAAETDPKAKVTDQRPDSLMRVRDWAPPRDPE